MPAIIQDVEPNNEDPQLELSFDTPYEDQTFEFAYDESNDEPDQYESQPLGPVLTTEDLLTTLKKAHSARLGKLVIKKLDNQET